MRDIKSLKENEAIQISTPVEKKRILKKAYKEGYSVRIIEDYAPSVFQIRKAQEDYLFWNHNFSNVSILPASDFLPKKKKKVTREWVEKYVAKALYAKQTQEAVERALQPSKEQISDLVTTDPADLDVNGAEVVGGLQEWKWFKLRTTSILIRIIKNLQKQIVLAYGFTSSGKWLNETDFGTSGLIPATKEEVENALIKEAKNRGFKIGVKYKCTVDGTTRRVERDFTYFSDTDLLTDGCGGAVYRKGKWATIIESEKEIDWGKAGQKLISTYNDVVVLNSGSSSSDHFEATVISDPESAYYVGHYSSIWKKKSFTLYTGEPITLSNEN